MLARRASRQASSSSRISVVDLAEGPGLRAKALSAAFADTGFAVVVNSGVPCGAVENLRAAAMDFFHQPLEEKQRANAPGAKGYGSSPYCWMEENGAQLLGDFSKPRDLVESLTSLGEPFKC